MKWLTDHHWPIWALPLGLFLVVSGGFTVLRGVIRLASKPRDAATPPAVVPPRSKVIGLSVFGGVFVLAGLASLYFVTIRPAYRASRAAAWPTVDGRVTSSAVAESRDSDGDTTYRIDIHYTYAVDGKPYESNQYDSTGTHMWSGYRDAKQAVVRAHPPGRTVTVHYDPADPADAMLSTDWPKGTVAFVWFPILFVGIGIAVPFFAARAARAAVATRFTRVPAAPLVADARQKRRRDFIGTLVFALFWNGIVGVFWFFAGRRLPWVVIPFALVGLGVIGLVVHYFRRLFNPLVSVQFARMPLRPGTRTEVTFTVGGNSLAVRSLAFELEGVEHATYQQGSSSRTEKHVAWSLPLYETTGPGDMERGRFAIDLPADVMPTFAAKNNRLVWQLRCRGDVAHRPRIDDTFDVTVSAAPDLAAFETKIRETA